ncbi:MAG: biotin carboxyl carrier domain-containing protein [Thermomicrobiales bacterium]|nr:biotin carboxyl carrier domain-containing protein [Thermomicrobiales bacterium]
MIRLVEAIERTGVTSFVLETGDVTLRLRRDGGEWVEGAPAEESPATASRPDSVEVVAPVLGTFYRRSAPDQPPFVEVGQQIEAGQTLCVLEVMKTYHEVVAPAAGTLTEFLIEDGQFVEYGQAIARIAG